MTDPDLEIPIWVQRLREDGFKVRMETGNEGLSGEPEFAFTLPVPPGTTLRRRVKDIARRLWQRGGRRSLPADKSRSAYLPGELLPWEQAMGQSSVIHCDPEILGGTPVFIGTRVPLRALIDYIEGGHALAEFLDDFPTVTREQVVSVLGEAEEALSERARAA